jgi:outer membrane protein assembly factor BamB
MPTRRETLLTAGTVLSVSGGCLSLSGQGEKPATEAETASATSTNTVSTEPRTFTEIQESSGSPTAVGDPTIESVDEEWPVRHRSADRNAYLPDRSVPDTAPTFEWHIGVTGLVPVLADETLYVTGNGRIRAVDALTGASRWVTEPDLPAQRDLHETPAVGNQVVVVQDSDGGVHALDREDGTHRWSRAVTDEHLSGGNPVVEGGTVYAVNDERVFALDEATGETRWEASTGQDPAFGSGVAVAGDRVIAIPNANDVNMDGPKVASFVEGELEWTAEAVEDGYEWPNPPTVAGDTVYVSGGFTVTAYDIETGERRWRAVQPETDRQAYTYYPPVVTDEFVVAAWAGSGGSSTPEHKILGIDRESGDIQWTNDSISVAAMTCVAGSTLLAGTRTWSFAALDVATGERRWELQPDGRAVGSGFVLADDVLFVAGDGTAQRQGGLSAWSWE